MAKRTENKSNGIDFERASKTADELAKHISHTLATSQPKSIAEGMLIITLAVGRVLQVLGMLLHGDQKHLCKDLCNALTKYFEIGGDSRIGDILSSMNQKGS